MSRTTVLIVSLIPVAGLVVPHPRGAAQDPFAESKPAPAVAPKSAAVAEAVPQEEKDPGVLAVRNAVLSGPEDVAWAVETLLGLGRADEAKKYLDTLQSIAADRPAQAKLHRARGTAFVMRLMREPALQPEGRQFGQAVMDAAYEAARDPGRIATLIGQLQDPAPEVRHAAIVDLRETDEAGPAALINVLADPRRAGDHAAARQALLDLRRFAEGPLLGALGSTDEAFRCEIIRILGQIGSVAARPFLLRLSLAEGTAAELRQTARQALLGSEGEVSGRAEAGPVLCKQVLRQLEATRTGESTADELVPVWHWEDARKSVAARMVPSGEASLVRAVQIAGELVAMAPDRAEYQEIYLVANLELAKRHMGLNQRLSPDVQKQIAAMARSDAKAVEQALQLAIEKDLQAAAVGAIEVLVGLGDERLLESTSGRPRPVAQALRHPDPIVRFAAAEAIIRWDPRHPYAGCSHLPETLAYFAQSAGSRRVLIGHPRVDQSQTLAGMLAELGLESDAAQSGRDVFRLASASPDYQFLLLSDALESPPVEDLVQQLRREPCAAALPIGIVAREFNSARLQRLCEEDPLTATFPRPFDLVGVAQHVRRLSELSVAVTDDKELHLHRAEVAIDYLTHVAENRQAYPFYDILSQQAAIARAMSVPRLCVKSAGALGFIGSPQAQRLLVGFASQNARALPERQAAARAFEVAVRTRGLVLSRGEILQQYDRYNQSAKLDQDTQKVLGSLLDTIESPSQRKD
jgi:hypothetical protein